MQEFYSNSSDLDGFDELKLEDKERIRKALQDGHVAKDDIPESAKKEGPAAEGTKSKVVAGVTLYYRSSEMSGVSQTPTQSLGA